MDEEKNIIVSVMDWLVNTLARTLVSLFDGVKNAVDHANPSLFSLIATLLPFALPLPVAFMTSHSARTFFSWDPWAANVLGFGLEGLGLLVWVKLVDAYIASLNSTNEKIDNFVGVLAVTAGAYEVLLVCINVVLALREGVSGVYALVLFLVCLLPALSAITYGIQRRETLNMLSRETQTRQDRQTKADEERRRREQDEIEYQRQVAEKIRQERRQDAMKRVEMKLQYSADTKQEALKEPFRRNGK
jgi:hypothetical protein